MKKVTCYYSETEGGRSPVRELIDSLAPKTQRKYFFVMGLLEEYGHRLPQPHADYVGDEIHELRFSGIEGAVRVLYFFFQQDKAIFTNGFIKKSPKAPLRERELAIKRKDSFFNRQE